MDFWHGIGFSSATETPSGTDGFHRIVQGAGVRIVQTPVRAPNANAYAERFVRSMREECLDRLILFGERRLLWAVDEFVAHYRGERNHRGLGNELIKPWIHPTHGNHRGLGNELIKPWIHPTHGTHVRCRERLGGLLRYYHRAA